MDFIEAMSAGDSDRAAQCITQETFTLAKGFGKFAGVRTYDTILGTIGAFRALMPEGMGVDILTVTAEGDRVAAGIDEAADTLIFTAHDNVGLVKDGLDLPVTRIG